MKFSSLAVATVCYAASAADAFTGSHMKPRFAVQVRVCSENDVASLQLKIQWPNLRYLRACALACLGFLGFDVWGSAL